MGGLSTTLGTLLGLFCCVAGLALAFVTGLDFLYGGLGLFIALLGGGLIWRLQWRTPRRRTEEPAEDEPHRSRPKPLPAAPPGSPPVRRDQKI
jgi:hypothetical protein